MSDGEFPEPPSEEDIDARLAAFKDRLKGTDKKQDSQGIEMTPTESHNLALGMSAAYVLIGLPLAGALVGWLIDRKTGGQTFAGVGVLIGGLIAVFHVVQLTKRQK